MACGTAPKVHIRPSKCEPDAGIYNIEYTGDDVDYTYSADGNSVDDEAYISDITTDAGEGFYQIAPHKEGDTLPNFTNNKERDDNGASTQTEEIPFFIKSDTPEVRATLNKLYGKVVDLRLTYNGDYEYKWEIIQDVRLTSKNFDASRRGWSVVFKKVNPEVEAKLLFKTDFATTKALVSSTAIA